MTKAKKIISFLLCFLFIFEQSGFAQVAGSLGVPLAVSNLSNIFIKDKFRPLHLRYLSYEAQSNKLNLLLDKGDEYKGLSRKGTDPKQIENVTKSLLNYFFIGLALPNSAFWVNLRPDGEDNIIDGELARTDVGKILLEADLQLKKDTAKYTSPETPEGKEYWDKLYQKAKELFGDDDISIPTLVRPWIVPGEIIIRETSNNAYIYKATLKVMLEEDYLRESGASSQGLGLVYSFEDKRLKTLNEYSAQLIRKLIIPNLTREINASKRYASLRQVYYSLILAQWFKAKFSGKEGPCSQLIERRDLNGLTSRIPWSKNTYFKAYQKSVKAGEYNIQQAVYTFDGQAIRTYFSGGLVFKSLIPQLGRNIIQGNPGHTPSGTSLIGVSAGIGSAGNPEAVKIEIEEAPLPSSLPAEGVATQGASSSVIGRVSHWMKGILGRGVKEKPQPLAPPQQAPEPPPPLRQATPEPAYNIKESPEAVEYSYGDFSGVDLEHFVHAQKRLTSLTKKGAPAENLRQVLIRLGLSPDLTVDKVYEELAKGKYNKEAVDIINGFDPKTGESTYINPRLDIYIDKQNKNARAQSIYEAVANSLDALGFKIGQFGKGVKQIIDWLEESGVDRIDVYARKENAKAYQLTIIKGKSGQDYIQIREIPASKFQDIAKDISGKDINKGAIVRVTTQKEIPLNDSQRDATQHNSLQEIVEGIHRRFPYVTSVEIETQIGNEEPQKVNGFKEKVIIVPADAEPYNPEEAKGKSVYARFNSHSITVVDNGAGMDAAIVSGMFVPKGGTKKPEFLSGEAAERELGKVKVVHDTSLPHRFSFARNGEVITAIDIPEGIHPEASVPGGLMVEFGLLLDVPESRDNVILSQAKQGEETGFQKAIMYAVSRIISHPRLSALDKARYINTIVIGLEGLIQGNENNNNVIKNIRALIQERLVPVIKELRQEGFIIFPHDNQFGKLKLPQDKEGKVLFIHEGLFNWQGAVSLREVGAEVIPLLKVGGEKRLPLLVVPFKPEYLKGALKFDRLWHTWRQSERIPMLKTDRFVALPLEFGSRLKELAEKKKIGRLDAKEEKEFAHLAQLVKIITAEEVDTTYEFAPKESLAFEETRFKREQGKIDSEAINEFLTQPPVAATPSQLLEAEASLDRVLGLAEKLSDLHSRSIAFSLTASVLAELGRQDKAETLVREALKIARNPENKYRTVIALAYAAKAYAKLGRKAQAVALLREVMDLEQLDNERVVRAIAEVLLEIGKDIETEALLKEILESARKLNSGYTQSVILSSLAYVFAEFKMTVEADVWAREAHTLAMLLSENKQVMAPALMYAAWAIFKSGRSPEAEALLEEAIGLTEDLTENLNKSADFSLAASIKAELGRTPEAENLVRRALGLARGITNDDLSASVALEYAAKALVKLGQTPKAEELLKEALELGTGLSDETGFSFVIGALAESAGAKIKRLREESGKDKEERTARQNKQEAEAQVEEALALLNSQEGRIFTQEILAVESPNDTLISLAIALDRLGRSSEANDLLDKVLKWAENKKIEFEKLRVLSDVAAALVKLGRETEADTLFSKVYGLIGIEVAEANKWGRISPGPELFAYLAKALAESGRVDRARKIAEEIKVKDEPQLPRPFDLINKTEALFSVATALVNLGRAAEANKLLDEVLQGVRGIGAHEALELLPSLVTLLSNLSRAAEANKIVDAALQEVRSQEGWNMLIGFPAIATALINLGRTKEAESLFSEDFKAAQDLITDSPLGLSEATYFSLLINKLGLLGRPGEIEVLGNMMMHKDFSDEIKKNPDFLRPLLRGLANSGEVDWVRNLIGKFAGNDMDPEKRAVWEHDSGIFLIKALVNSAQAKLQASSKEAPATPNQAAIFSDTMWRDDAVVVNKRLDGKFEPRGVIGPFEGKLKFFHPFYGALSGPFTRIERAGRDKEVFIGYREDGEFVILSPSRKVLFDSVREPRDCHYSVVTHKGELVILERSDAVISEKSQVVFDLRNSKFTPAFLEGMFSRKISFSASGRYSVHEKSDGELVYYDHRTGEDAHSYKIDVPARALYEYRVHEKADVIITQYEGANKYCLFSLTQGKFLIDDMPDHIEIDSSGQVAILKRGDELSYIWLEKTIEFLGPSGELASASKRGVVEKGGKIRVSSDDKYTYLMRAAQSGEIEILRLERDKEDAEVESLSLMAVTGASEWGRYKNVRYWEEYDLEKKTIWDMETKGEPASFAALPGASFNGRLNYANNPPTNPGRIISLYGNIIHVVENTVAGAELTLIDLDIGVFDGSGPGFYNRLEPLEGRKVWHRLNQDGNIGVVTILNRVFADGRTKFALKFWGEFQVTPNNKFILATNAAGVPLVPPDFVGKSLIIDSNGTVVDITKQIPEGFVYTDINREYFIFVNPATGQVKYLDPQLALTQSPLLEEESQISPEDAARKAQVAAKWNKEVLSRRDSFIAQAQAAYQPFLALIPEDLKGEIERIIKGKIEQLYAEQDMEIRKKFQDAFASGEPIKLDHLIFDHFSAQMARINPLLKEYIKSLGPRLAQERYEAQRQAWSGLFIQLFMLCANTSLNGEAIDRALLRVLSYGWDIATQEQLNAVPLINNLITSLQADTVYISIAMQTMKIIKFLSDFASKNPAANIPILQEQLGKILSLKPEVRRIYLEKLVNAFIGVDNRALNEYLQKPSNSLKLGKAREFAVFLTHQVNQLSEREKFIPQGRERIPLGHDGVSITQIIQLEEQRKKPAADKGKLMSISALISAIENNLLPQPSEEDEAKFRLDAKAQTEPGAYTREIAQNSSDATSVKQKELAQKKEQVPSGQEYKGELTVSFYLQKEPDGRPPKHSIEEAVDNGTGALQEEALIIPVSTKQEGKQKEFSGYFGTGNNTRYEGLVESVEVINKNSERAYMFTFTIARDSSGNPIDIKLTSIREVDDANVAEGLTVRRIKSIDETIPELDAMLAERAWRTFAGLSQNDNFKIYFIDREGKRQPLQVKHEVLAEADFKALERGKGEETNFGKMRIIATEDMPLQIVDRAGLRVCELKEEYLALIPEPLRRHIQELGINIEIPLNLIRTRSGFEHENEYLSLIQRYVAIQFYRAIAYKALIQKAAEPQFIFEGLASDWETNPAEGYWESLLKDEGIKQLSNKINAGDYNSVTENELSSLLSESGKLNETGRSFKLLLTLKVDTGKSAKESMLLRRIAIQQASKDGAADAEKYRKLYEKEGLLKESDKAPDIKDIPYAQEKLGQAKSLKDTYKLLLFLTNIEVNPQDYTDSEKELLALAWPIAEQFGLENIILVQSSFSAGGCFTTINGKKVMILNRSLANSIGRRAGPFIDIAADTIVHELAHLLEELMSRDDLAEALKGGYIAHTSDFTHQPRGPFAEAMKYVAAVTLMNHGRENGEVSGLSKEAADRAHTEAVSGTMQRFMNYVSDMAAKENVFFALPGTANIAEELHFSQPDILKKIGEDENKLSQFILDMNTIIGQIQQAVNDIHLLGERIGIFIPQIERIIIINDKGEGDIMTGRSKVGDRIMNELVINIARLFNSSDLSLVKEKVPTRSMLAHELGHIMLESCTLTTTGDVRTKSPFLYDMEFRFSNYPELPAVTGILEKALKELAAFWFAQNLLRGTQYEEDHRQRLRECLEGEQDILPMRVILLVIAERAIPLDSGVVSEFKQKILSDFNDEQLFTGLYSDFVRFYDSLRLKPSSGPHLSQGPGTPAVPDTGTGGTVVRLGGIFVINGQKEIKVEGTTLGEVLNGLPDTIKNQVLNPDGTLSGNALVVVNNEPVASGGLLGKLNEPLPDGAAISIIPGVAGGAEEGEGNKEWEIQNEEVLRFLYEKDIVDEVELQYPDIIKNFGYRPFKELYVAAGENARELFFGRRFSKDGLRKVKDIFTPEELKLYWPDLVRMGIAAGENALYFFNEGLPIVKKLFTPEEFKLYWPDLVRLGVTAGGNINHLFAGNIPRMKEFFTPEEFKLYWPDLVRLGVTAGIGSPYVFNFLIYHPEKTPITDQKSLNAIGGDFIKIFQLCEGVEERTSNALDSFDPLFQKFPSSWSKFVKPVIYNQTVGAFLCLYAVIRLFTQGAIQTEADLELIKDLIIKQGVQAYDTLKNFLEKGIVTGVISKPLSTEKEPLETFLSRSKYLIPELYQAYKNNPEELDSLVARCENIHQKIFSADTVSVENDPLFAAMLLYVFPPVVTTQREQYHNLYKSRPDRPEDTKNIPQALQGKQFEVAAGKYTLKDPSRPLDETPWRGTLDIVREVNKEEVRSVDEDEVKYLGRELLEQWQRGALYKSRNSLLTRLYRYYRYSRGAKLPETLTSIPDIMALKEFVGDTLRDLIAECIVKYQESDSQGYQSIVGKMFKAKIENPTRVAKSLLGILNQLKDNPEKAKQALGRMLRIEDTDALDRVWEGLKDKTKTEEITQILEEISFKPQPGKEAQVILHQLQGEEYKAMQGEVSSKYEFNESGEKLALSLVVSKRKAHGVIGLNMGVCVAPDEKLWDNPNFMNAIIFDQDNIARGGMHILIIEDNGKRYLTLPGINPTPNLLAKVNADDIYNKLISYAGELARALGCEAVLIPTNATIHSNRTEIQRVISAKNYQKVSLSKIHEFSYSPSTYSFQDCFIAGRTANLSQSQGPGTPAEESPPNYGAMGAANALGFGYERKKDAEDAIKQGKIEEAIRLLQEAIGYWQQIVDDPVTFDPQDIRYKDVPEIIKLAQQQIEELKAAVSATALEKQNLSLSSSNTFIDTEGLVCEWHPGVKNLSPWLKAILEKLGIGIRKVPDAEWNKFEQILTKSGGFPADARAVLGRKRIDAREHLRFSQDFNRAIAHELGHFLDVQFGLMELLAGQNEEIIKEIANLGFENSNPDLSKWHEGLLGGDRNGIPGEAVAQALGKWLLNPDGVLKSHPKVAKVFAEKIESLLSSPVIDIFGNLVTPKVIERVINNLRSSTVRPIFFHGSTLNILRGIVNTGGRIISSDEAFENGMPIMSGEAALGTGLQLGRFVSVTTSFKKALGYAELPHDFNIQNVTLKLLEAEKDLADNLKRGYRDVLTEISERRVRQLTFLLAMLKAASQDDIRELTENDVPIVFGISEHISNQVDGYKHDLLPRTELRAAGSVSLKDVTVIYASSQENIDKVTGMLNRLGFNHIKVRLIQEGIIEDSIYWELNKTLMEKVESPEEYANAIEESKKISNGDILDKLTGIIKENRDASILSQGPGTPAEGQQLGREGEVGARLMGLRNGIGQEALVALAKEDPKIVGLLREALSRETDPAMRARIQEVIDAADKRKGGIDFRALPIQPLGRVPLGTQAIALTGRVPKLNNFDLNTEWRKIENSVEQGNIPAAESIKEYLQASCLKGSADKDIDKVLSCIANILRIEEDFYIPTEPMLIDILVVVESANSLPELKAVFIGNSQNS